MLTLTFKVSPEEAAQIRQQARREGLTLSAFLRRRATQPAPPASSGAGGYHVEPSPRTGLPVMHAPSGTPPVTPEQVRALLADFP